MRALVTGAAGFVGRRLCAHLAAQGWEVIGCDVSSMVPRVQPGVLLACDVADQRQVAALFNETGPVTHVFHLAAVTFVPEAERDPGHAFSVNVAGTKNVVLNMLSHAPDARLIFIATADMYGRPTDLPVRETHPLNPLNAYSESKMAAEAYCVSARKMDGLRFVGMRSFNHTGPGQSEKFVLPSFARQIARAEAGLQAPVMRVGNLESARDFSHVDDIVRAYELAALKGQDGEVYNVCSGKSVVIGEALQRMLAMSNIEMTIETDPDRLRGAESTKVYGSHQKLTEATSWTPQRSFDTILSDLLTYWRSR